MGKRGGQEERAGGWDLWEESGGGGEEKVNDCTIKECHELSEL